MEDVSFLNPGLSRVRGNMVNAGYRCRVADQGFLTPSRHVTHTGDYSEEDLFTIHSEDLSSVAPILIPETPA